MGLTQPFPSGKRQGQRDALPLPSTSLLRKGLRFTAAVSGEGAELDVALVLL